ncbi:hypothetical protein [Cupriavidus basilensis]|uniref:hypothetical protein n=1 Tax=Cupriavidus basilensis TaxID=68895 RepID=UPI0020A629FC|nr:hypothetical protein [Cupriavidus basilensis]MCP3024976.1 hypothetical protein [Cupriavidus basilensis]
MNAQEIFTKVATHLLTQKQRARGDGGIGCRYRTNHGLTCAVGCLVPEDLYDASMELTSIDGVIQRAREAELPPSLSKFVLTELDPHKDLLAALQWLHDNQPVDAWESHLIRVAKTHRLVMPPLGE